MIQKILLFIGSIVLCSAQAFAHQNCFLIKAPNKYIYVRGNANTRYSPCSTFKIALALMGYDSGILQDETRPQWLFKPEYEAFLDSWKTPQNPSTWMKNSCVWYSQILTPQLGMKKLQHYVKIFHYGNEDLSGDKGFDNGIKKAWLSSSLEISPREQIRFLEKLLANKLPVSKKAQAMTRALLYIEALPNGWKLYGKTGGGFLLSADREQKSDIKHGWFIGWIEKENKKIIFVNHMVDSQKEESHVGPRARAQVKEKLLELTN